MADYMEILKGRRSVRKFTNEMPAREQIESIMEAGIWAGSGMGKQSAIVIAVTDKELRDKISAANAEIMGKPGIDPFYGAPAILIVAANKAVPTRVYDGSLALGNMMLRAHELGLGTCWIHRAKEEFETELGKEILARAGVEGEYEGVGHLALGYADGDIPAPVERREGRVFFID